MLVPHWLIGLAIFVALASFIVFAFRQRQRVKPDQNKKVGRLGAAHERWRIRANRGGARLELRRKSCN
jgi:hypothetical protein